MEAYHHSQVRKRTKIGKVFMDNKNFHLHEVLLTQSILRLPGLLPEPRQLPELLPDFSAMC